MDTLAKRIDTIRGRQRSADDQPPGGAQDAPGFGNEPAPAAHSAENLNQHDGVEGRVRKRQMPTVRSHQTRGRLVALGATPERAQHAEGEVDPDIVVPSGDECLADAARPGADIQHGGPCQRRHRLH